MIPAGFKKSKISQFSTTEISPKTLGTNPRHEKTSFSVTGSLLIREGPEAARLSVKFQGVFDLKRRCADRSMFDIEVLQELYRLLIAKSILDQEAKLWCF